MKRHIEQAIANTPNKAHVFEATAAKRFPSQCLGSYLKRDVYRERERESVCVCERERDTERERERRRERGTTTHCGDGD